MVRQGAGPGNGAGDVLLQEAVIEAQRVVETKRVAIGDFCTFEMDIWQLKVEIVDIREIEVKQTYHSNKQMMVQIKVGRRFMFPGAQVQALGENEFKREYLGIPAGGQASPFTWDLYERATQSHPPLVAPGPAFGPQAEPPGVRVPNPFALLKK